MVLKHRTQTRCVCLAAALFGVITVTLACHKDELVTYRLDIETHWSKELFPKQYPLFRPPAQFTKFVGMSHNGSRVLFRAGELASEGVRRFAEDGDASGLELVAQGHPGVLDQFTAPPVKQGQGTALVRLFVDGLHSKVSLMSRIVPSPDWFIGIDSLDLCDAGHWVSDVSVKLYPMDAGTDQGLTFTAPNWVSDPHEPICQITSSRPAHPAGSFNYPDRKQLPPIASLRFSRVRSFAMSNDFELGDSVSYSVETTDPNRVLLSPTSHTSSAAPGLRIFTVTSTNSTSVTSSASSGESHHNHGGGSKTQHHEKSNEIETKKFSSGRSANALPHWPVKNKAKSDEPMGNSIASQQAKPEGKWSLLSTQGSRQTSRYSYPNLPAATPLSSPRRSDQAILRPSDPSQSPVAPSASVTRVALHPDGSVARVAIRPDGPPVQIGGLRVWAVNSNELDAKEKNHGRNSSISWRRNGERSKHVLRKNEIAHARNSKRHGDRNRSAWNESSNEVRTSHAEASDSVRPVNAGGTNLHRSSTHLDGDSRTSLDGARVPAGDRSAIMRRISDHYRRHRGRHRRRRMRHRRRKRIPRDCSVGEWSAWGTCSRTCGIGETTRVRSVVRHARRGGKPCPPLSDRRWCGSERACRHGRRYFQW